MRKTSRSEKTAAVSKGKSRRTFLKGVGAAGVLAAGGPLTSRTAKAAGKAPFFKLYMMIPNNQPPRIYLRDVQGRRGIYNFRIVCDEINNTPEVIETNRFIGDFYIQPAKSINFILLNFIATRTGVDFDEIVNPSCQ